jgi:hypothetical protein
MIVSMTFAQNPEQAKCPMMDKDKGMMMGMGKEGMPPMMDMMRMMGNLVATSDGGVVVMMGNRLYKYDKNLNLIKETEMKIDMKSMHEMMKKQVAPEDTSGHESHHTQ